jgi:hypothetical protein
MTDLRKAAEMALEVMEYNRAKGTPNMGAAIEALRQALAMERFSEVNQEIEEAIKKGTKAWADVPDATKWVDELRGEPEQESFIVDRGCWERGCMAYDWRDGDAVNIRQERVDETAKREHEPVAWMKEEWYVDDVGLQNTREVLYGYEVYGGKPLYTAPPKREWVGLTDEDLFDYPTIQLGVNGCVFDSATFAKLIESKLKEKNT